MKRRISSGFTLIELIIVVVIIGILTVSVAPRFFTGDGSTNVATVHAQALSMLRLQQQRAMQDTAFRCYGVLTGASIQRTASSNTSICDVVAVSEGAIDLSAVSFTVTSGPTSGFLFNGLGCPVSLAHESSIEACGSSSIQWEFASGGSTRYVCIQSQGYIRSGVC
ncbi:MULTISPECIES: prepilin-type N-terminal cleavage/methylation domain-containing protein [Gammaproteobacteria]|uniref:prepilin-type N-terminal cleavage/methylation domain-containing protein n=1 Tax=Gammaproteobacteria TaxID=1236 RepID=UPI000DD0E154|nr:prepilin-type N-terminal cleavage/methylation domain-containing protein [Aliidiomarina sp. B3213]RTE86376.1 prepilin-type N-terminal cleavage/methylation domain-containing protein [Aliidiomarina sp. B3213]TCZ91724.1 prepilin-type N-terminal cleavage/methylation domain-containing protein [Lysobacter sp. N42]